MIFPKIDDGLLKKGLEEALKHQINLIEDAVQHNLGEDILESRKQRYAGLSKAAQAVNVNTESYDLTCSKLLDKMKQKSP